MLIIALLLAVGGVVWIGRSLGRNERILLAVVFVLGLAYIGTTLTEMGLLGNRTSNNPSRSEP